MWGGDVCHEVFGVVTISCIQCCVRKRENCTGDGEVFWVFCECELRGVSVLL